MAATAAQVVAAFRSNQFKLQDGDLPKRCVDLTAQYGITATELSDAYDLFALQKWVLLCCRTPLARIYAEPDLQSNTRIAQLH